MWHLVSWLHWWDGAGVVVSTAPRNPTVTIAPSIRCTVTIRPSLSVTPTITP